MKHFLTLLLSGVLAVMAFVFAAYLVFTSFRPEREMELMLREMAQLQTVRYDAGFSWSQDVGGNRVSTTLYGTGQIDASQAENVEHATKFRVVHLSEDASYQDLSGELRKVDSQTYLTYEAPGPDVEGVDFEKQVWVAFASGELPGWGSVLPGLNAPVESMTDTGAWTVEGVERLRTLIPLMDLFYVDHNGLTQIIDGANTRIIDGRFDQDAVEAFLLDWVRAKEGQQPTDAHRVLAAQQAEKVSRMTLRFWIGTQDHLLYRLQGAGGFVQEDTHELMPMDVRIELSAHNEPVDIEKPEENTVAFTQVLQGLSGGLQGSDGATFGDRQDGHEAVVADSARLPVTEVEQSNDPDGDGLDNLLERFYGTDMNNPDTDGDGLTDGEEVHSGLNPKGNGSLFGFGLGL